MSTNNNTRTVGCTIPIGGIIAAILSYHVNASVLWAIFHFLCGWLYIIYWLIFRWV